MARAAGGPSFLARARLIVVVGAVAAVAAASCSGGTTTPVSPSASSPVTTTQPAGAASGCGFTAPGRSSTLTLSIDGRSRVVIVHLPAGYTGATPLALVLNMHGSGSTAAQQEGVSGMDAAADRSRFIVVYPQALIANGQGFDWDIPNVPLVSGAYPPPGAADDVAFLTALVPALAARYCVNTQQVFATGLSGGGRMASQLVCDAPATFAAVAPVAGLRFPAPCPAATPVPVIAFHGTADPVDPYNGNGRAYWTYSVPTAAARWAAHDGCQASPKTSPGNGYALTSYAGCAGGSTVELYSVTGEGHEWPGGPRLPALARRALGPQSNAVDANSVMWAFFEAHARG